MKKYYRLRLFSVPAFVVLFLVSAAAISSASDVDANIARIQKAYENIRDLRGSFAQKSIIKDLNKTETYKGEFFIKPPLRMKWVYKGATAQDLTINNNTVLIFKKGEGQAYKGTFDRQTYGQTPVALLSGFGDIRDEFSVSGGGNSLTLVPKKPMGNVASISITMSGEGFPIRSFTVNDTHANVIEIQISGVKINTGLKDALFDLSLPKGVNVFEQ